tara:strand:- start:74783 stop:75835 length:1053 start_codon:yes stop_codon:yes gene_type:complete
MSTSFPALHADYALWIGMTAIGLTLLLILVMTTLRIILNRNRNIEAKFLAIWQPLLSNPSANLAETIIPLLPAAHYLPFLKLWNKLVRTSTGERREDMLDIAYALGCERYAKKLLTHGDRTERLLAILTLSHLRDISAWDALATQTLHADSVTSINAFHALVQIDPDTTAHQLMPLLLARTDWPITHIASILQREQSTFMQPLIVAANEIKSTHLVRTLRLIEALHIALPQTSLLQLLNESNNVETIIATLRITNDVSMLPRIRVFLRHADWRLRVQAAKALGRIGEYSDVNRLIPLLADSYWWVRYRSTQALVNMPFLSINEIAVLQTHLSDRFARDMLSQVMAERKSS